MAQSFNIYDIHEVTLSLNTSEYADGDLLADTQEVSGAFRDKAGSATLLSLVLLDEDDNGGALDVVFLRSDEAMGTENDAFDITDAKAEEILTVVEFTSGDYVDLTSSQVAVKNASDGGMGVVLEPTSGTSLYVAAISRDTQTYTAAGIVMKIGLLY